MRLPWAVQRPLLLIIEDLQWVDPSSSDLLFHLSRQIGDSPILIVGTYRPEEVALNRPAPGAKVGARHPMAGLVSELKRRHGDIWLDLGALAEGECRHFVEAYLDTQPNRLGPAFREKLFQHTGGHALFTVEVLREMVDHHQLIRDEEGRWVESESIDWQALPAKVEGVIERRINRLAEALQSVLTIASVEGETFTAEVVARVQQLNERRLVQRLSQELDKQHRLVTAQALDWLGRQRLSGYRFRHQLFQHYLYRRLDETERAYLHEEVGNVLEALYGDQTERVAVQLARHFVEAGLTEKAVGYLRQAGERAMQLSANEEAIGHFNKGLALLNTLPDTPERARQEVRLQIPLGHALIATKGYGAPEVEQTFNQARVLCRQVGETPELFRVLWGLAIFYSVRAQHKLALELRQQMLQLAQNAEDQSLHVVAHWSVGITLYYNGELALAHTHLEQGIACYDPHQHHTLAFHYGHDPGASCLSFLAWDLWLLGYPAQALARSHEALVRAREASHPLSLAYATFFATWLHQHRRDWPAAQEHAEALLALSTEQGFAFYEALGTFSRGVVRVKQGQVAAGIAQMRQGLADFRALEAEMFAPEFLGYLAEAYGLSGQAEEGLSLLVEALAAGEKTGEQYWDAELYRLKGELLRQAEAQAVEDEAENCFHQAIRVAGQQQAKSLELRAVMSLGRLWQKQEKKGEARKRLAEIYGWFSEGFDTADLKEARALLAEWERSPTVL
jgi:predicted ATPase